MGNVIHSTSLRNTTISLKAMPLIILPKSTTHATDVHYKIFLTLFSQIKMCVRLRMQAVRENETVDITARVVEKILNLICLVDVLNKFYKCLLG